MQTPPSTSTARVVVIVPTYNEARNIEPLARQVLAQPGDYDVLVIDDNSQDGTADKVRELQQEYSDRIHIIERPEKLGLGTAYVRGFQWALEKEYDLICEMDADLSHNPNDLPRLIQAIEAGADLAIGSRYVNGVRILNWPLSRLMLSYFAGMYTRTITRMPIMDVTAGFKCFRREVLEAIDFARVRSNGYAFQVEMNYRVFKKGFTIVEVPITFTERTEGQSKLSKGIVREATLKVWELRLRALVGRL